MNKRQLKKKLRVIKRVILQNQVSIERSNNVGCLYCCYIEQSSSVENWSYEPNGNKTALCSNCGLDFVFGDYCGIEINRKMLKRLSSINFNGYGSQNITTPIIWEEIVVS